MTFSVQVLKMGECDVAGPEVFWMSHWHEWVTLHFWMVVIRGPGVTAIVNTGPPSDLADLNARWHAAFGARGEMRREERERPLNALASLGVRTPPPTFSSFRTRGSDVQHLHVGNRETLPSAGMRG